MPDLLDTINKIGRFNTLVTAVTATGFNDTLKRSGQFTFFAPTDEGFSKLPRGAFDSLLDDIIHLRKILEYHVISNKLRAANLAKIDSVKTSEGSDIKINASGCIKVNDATVIESDIDTDNGIIHIIDTVLMIQ